MHHMVKKSRHIILLTVLIGSDVLIGFFGHYTGSGASNFLDYITTISIEEIAPVIGVAIGVVIFVEWLFRR